MVDPIHDMTTIGETLLRISVGAGVALETTDTAQLHAAGAESNVACALARLGRRVAWSSRLPDTPPGRLIANTLRGAGVDLSQVAWFPAGRVGTFYVELAPSPAPVRVTYDRAHSLASEMTPDSIDSDALLRTRLLHLTGITPALSDKCGETMRFIVDAARASGIPRSFDINYRRKLWSAEEARRALVPLARGCDILFIARSDAREVFGIAESPERSLEAIRDLIEARRVVFSIGEEGVLAWDGGGIRHQPAMPTAVIDRLGAGDALAAGVIHGWLDGDFAAGLQYGAALAAICLRSHGDLVITTPRDLQEYLADSSSRPRR